MARGESLRALPQIGEQLIKSPDAVHRIGCLQHYLQEKCVLEIDLEIVAALPDKVHRSYRGFLSKSPNIFASGGATRSRTALPSGHRAYANTSVGTFVGIYEVTSSRWLVQRSDMNSVGGPVMLPTIPEIHKKSPAQARPAAFQLPSLPNVAQ